MNSRHDDSANELRLEGFRLLATVIGLGGVVLAAVVGAFLLGRWVERRAQPVQAIPGTDTGALAQVLEPEAFEAGENLGFFDDVDGGQKELEPGREVGVAAAATPSPTRKPQEAQKERTPSVAVESLPVGDFWVQVFAGRDRDSAESLIVTLHEAGYPVRLITEREGARGLFKVRVGGYDEEQARTVARELQGRGYSGAWVTRAS